MVAKVIGGVHFTHDMLSETCKCKECGKGIKQRLVLIKRRTPELCYRCYQDSRRAAKIRKQRSNR